MEKLIRALMLGFVLSVATLIGLGWKAYAEIDTIRTKIKGELKAEMVEIRNRDMEWIQSRFNSLEMLYAGKVLSPQREFQGKDK